MAIDLSKPYAYAFFATKNGADTETFLAEADYPFKLNDTELAELERRAVALGFSKWRYVQVDLRQAPNFTGAIN